MVSDMVLLSTKVNDLENILKILEDKVCQIKQKCVEPRHEDTGIRSKPFSSIKSHKCSKCDEVLETKYLLKKHIKSNHKKLYNCQVCEDIFDETWKLEAHMKDHDKKNEHECDHCGKTFHLNWRLMKHLNLHEKKNVRKCHYFNNSQACPFEDIGCMFLHEESDICYFGNKCYRKLCQYRHPEINITDKEITSAEEMPIANAKESDTDKIKDKVLVGTIEIKCVVCQLELQNEKKRFRCDECEYDVCNSCHKKTFCDKDWFMCLICQ